MQLTNYVQFSDQNQVTTKKKSSRPANVQFSAQNQVKIKKMKVITPARRSLFCNFPNFFAEE